MREQVVNLGPQGMLYGVLTVPESQVLTEWGVVFLNAGLVHKVGPNRLHVQLARALARHGFVSLRFDFSGIGDSPARADRESFERSSIEETRAALDWLSSKQGCQNVVLVGMCSGGQAAFRTGLEDERVRGMVLVNASGYREEPTQDTLDRVARVQDAHYHWRVAIYNPRNWARLFSGRTQYSGVRHAIAYKLREWLWRPSTLGAAGRSDIEGFEALLRRRVQVLLLFTEGDWGLDYLRMMLARELKEQLRMGNPRVEIIPRSDHILTPLVARHRAVSCVIDWARGLSGGSGGSG